MGHCSIQAQTKERHRKEEMNRRKFLGACAGAAVVAVAASKVVTEPEVAPTMDRPFHNGKPFIRPVRAGTPGEVRWVNSEYLYSFMRAGWKEHQVNGALISKLVAHNQVAHLMVFNG